MTHTPRCRSPLLASLAAAVLASVLLLSACISPPQPPSEPAGITGSVTSVVAGDGRPASMLVESTGTPAAGAISDKAQVNIPPATMFFGPEGKAATLDSIMHIAQGTRVRVWFEGAVAESYPVQGSAKAVQILSK